MKIRSVLVKLLHVDGQTDRQTDMMKLIVTFYSYANVSKIWQQLHSLNEKVNSSSI